MAAVRAQNRHLREQVAGLRASVEGLKTEMAWLDQPFFEELEGVCCHFSLRIVFPVSIYDVIPWLIFFEIHGTAHPSAILIQARCTCTCTGTGIFLCAPKKCICICVCARIVAYTIPPTCIVNRPHVRDDIKLGLL